MTDLTETIAPKSDQINADDLITGPRTITIREVSRNASPDQPINIYFQGDDNKPFRPCKSMRRVLVHVWGSNGVDYVGRSMTLYRDPEVTFGGAKVGGIRISHMSHIDGKQTMALTAAKARRKPYVVEPLRDAPQREQQRAAEGESLPDHIAKMAEDMAQQGVEAFRSWWNTPEAKGWWGLLKPQLSHYQQLASKADQAKSNEPGEDPFGLTDSAGESDDGGELIAPDDR